MRRASTGRPTGRCCAGSRGTAREHDPHQRVPIGHRLTPVFRSDLGDEQRRTVSASETMVTYLYKFELQRLAIGYGSAVATILFVLCLAFSLFYQRTLLRDDLAGSVSRAV
jgi:hypothetical protein